MRSRLPLALVDAYWDDQGQALCPMATGISHHINPWGDIEPCPIIQFATENIHDGRDVFDVIKEGTLFKSVITVCDQASAQRCPVFPGAAKRLHWSFPDPSVFDGPMDEKLQKTREVNEAIKDKIIQWLSLLK